MENKNGFFNKALFSILGAVFTLLQIIILLYVAEINNKIDKNYNEIKDNRKMIIDHIATDK